MKRASFPGDSVNSAFFVSTLVPSWGWVNVAYQPVALGPSEEEELEAMLPAYKP